MPMFQNITNTGIYSRNRNSQFVKHGVFLLIASAVFNLAPAQSVKNLTLADEYYASGEYLTAAGLYQQYLHPPVKKIASGNFPLNSKKSAGALGHFHDKTDIVYKQAESYRLANYWSQALGLYQQCFQKDSSTFASALYWMAVCERSLGNYASAEEKLRLYLLNAGEYKAEAEKEKINIQFIKSQLVRPDSILYHVQKTEVPGNGGSYAFTKGLDNHFLLTGTQADSVTQDGINPVHNRIFNSSFSNGKIENLTSFKIEGINTAFNQGTATLSADGNYIYFTQWSKENGKTVSSIYYATKKGNAWVRPSLVTTLNQQGHNSQQPFCSADGKYLFFASDRRGGIGKMDIWYAPIQGNGKTGVPVNAGLVVNTTGNELAPFYQASSSTLIFASDRTPGMGGYDLFQSTGSENNWQAAENMGSPVNSSRDDIYFFAAENEDILGNAFISSDRGSECCLGIYNISKSEKKKILTGVIRDCENNQPIAGAEIILQDTAGTVLHGTTNEEGQYSFNLPLRTGQGQVSVIKEGYNQQVIPVKIESSVQSWLEETWNNAAICMPKHQEEVRAENVVSIYFDFDKSKLTIGGKSQLDSIYDVLAIDSTILLQISGYTDGRGSEVYNKTLSDKRAKTCADYLIQKGINPARITFESFGACCPVEMEKVNGRDNGDARAMNRRALINVKRQ
jgi:OmpA-OmpF porin, OOP family